MTRYDLNNEYFEWMYRLVYSHRRYSAKTSYRKLLGYLHSVNFDYILTMDGNRAEDGINLRYRFGYERSYDDPMIASYLDDRPCSVLEMMIALSIRCEEHIMGDPDIGDRTGLWFWLMIDNLKLEEMTDIHFDLEYVEEVVLTFLNREYKRNGEGGLFTVENCRQDLRSMEIWYQMCWYLDNII